METQKLIASFNKNSVEVIKVHLQEWKNQRYVDIRVWAQARAGDGEAAAHPTYKGITLSVELLGELKKAVDKCWAAVEMGEGEEPEGEKT